MVQVQKAEKKAVYRYLLQEGVIVIHKDFTTQLHKGTNVPNINARLLLRSLKDRGLVELVFSWQYFYYFINEQGKKYLSDYLNLTEEVVPLTWKYHVCYLERTRRGNTSISSRIKAEKSEGKPEIDPREREKEEEARPGREEKGSSSNQFKPKSQPKPQLPDQHVKLIFKTSSLYCLIKLIIIILLEG